MNVKFQFDKNIKKGNYSSKYFLISKKILKDNKNSNDVTIKFFHFSKRAIVCGTNECIQLIKFCLTKEEFKNIKIWYKNDGEESKAFEPILVIRGDYRTFGYLENIIDGILARRSSVATNCKEIVNLVGDTNKIIFMADRSDDYLLQRYDGYAAYVGGIRNFVTKEQLFYIKKDNDVKYIGTMPHALIQQHNGDLCKAMKNYIKKNKPPYIALIDYHNDCLKEIDLLNKNGIKNIDYVRIDTSNMVIDKSLKKFKSNKKYYGVNKYLIKIVRSKLDDIGWIDTKIIISSGLNFDSIKKYLSSNTPIDIYGIGKNLIKIDVNFTGDLIKIGDKYESKFGRNKIIESDLKRMMFYIEK